MRHELIVETLPCLLAQVGHVQRPPPQRPLVPLVVLVLRFRDEGAQGLGFRVYGLGFRVWGLGSRV